jgi:hypothetical protein
VATRSGQVRGDGSVLWRGRGGGRSVRAMAPGGSGAAGGGATRGGLVPSRRRWRGRAARGGGQIPMAQIWARRAPSGPGRVCLLSVTTSPVSWWWWFGAMQEGSGGLTYVQQRGGGDFTGPIWVRPGLLGRVCPCCHVRSAPADGGGGSPLGGCAVAALRFEPFYLFRLTCHVMYLTTRVRVRGCRGGGPGRWTARVARRRAPWRW